MGNETIKMTKLW